MVMVVRNGKTHILSKEDIEYYKNMSKEERVIRQKIAYEEAHYRSVQTILTHGMELLPQNKDNYLDRISETKQRRDEKVKELKKNLEEVLNDHNK